MGGGMTSLPSARAALEMASGFSRIPFYYYIKNTFSIPEFHSLRLRVSFPLTPVASPP